MSKRFISQYSAPKEVISDNGSAFTSKEVKELLCYILYYGNLIRQKHHGQEVFSNVW